MFYKWASLIYLVPTLTDQSCMHEEKNFKINSGNACYHSVRSLLPSRLLSRNVKVKICKTRILPFLLYKPETWSLILTEEHRVTVIENMVLREYVNKWVMKWEVNVGSWTVRRFVTYTHHQISLRRSSQGEWVGQDMWRAWQRRKIVEEFGGKSRRKETNQKREGGWMGWLIKNRSLRDYLKHVEWIKLAQERSQWWFLWHVGLGRHGVGNTCKIYLVLDILLKKLSWRNNKLYCLFFFLQ
jgi:hypothetical protein